MESAEVIIHVNDAPCAADRAEGYTLCFHFKVAAHGRQECVM